MTDRQTRVVGRHFSTERTVSPVYVRANAPASERDLGSMRRAAVPRCWLPQCTLTAHIIIIMPLWRNKHDDDDNIHNF